MGTRQKYQQSLQCTDAFLVNLKKKVFMADGLIPVALFKMVVGWPNIVKLWHHFELYM